MRDQTKDDLTVPKAGKGDVALILARAGISTIPYLGGPAKELLAFVIVPPLERRRAEWMNAVGERLKQLEKEVEGFKLEDLAKNELFVTVVQQATTVALRTHQEEKLQALQNAIVNTARGIEIDENLQLLFLNAVDDLTRMHLKVLSYFDSPREWFENRNYRVVDPTVGESAVTVTFPNGTSTILTQPGAALSIALALLSEATTTDREAETYRTLSLELKDSIVTDLFSRGLINIDKNGLLTMAGSDAFASRTTLLGKRFLEYISEWRPMQNTRAFPSSHGLSS